MNNYIRALETIDKQIDTVYMNNKNNVLFAIDNQKNKYKVFQNNNMPNLFDIFRNDILIDNVLVRHIGETLCL